MLGILSNLVLLKGHTTIQSLSTPIFGVCPLLPCCRLWKDLRSYFSWEVLGRSANWSLLSLSYSSFFTADSVADLW